MWLGASATWLNWWPWTERCRHRFVKGLHNFVVTYNWQPLSSCIILWSNYLAAWFRSSSSVMLSAEPLLDRSWPMPCNSSQMGPCQITNMWLWPAADYDKDRWRTTTLLHEAEDDTVKWLESTATIAFAKWINLAVDPVYVLFALVNLPFAGLCGESFQRVWWKPTAELCRVEFGNLETVMASIGNVGHCSANCRHSISSEFFNSTFTYFYLFLLFTVVKVSQLNLFGELY